MCRMKIRKIVDVWKIIEIQSVSLFCWSVNPHQILANSNSTYAPPSEKFWNQSSRRTCFMTICIIGSHYHWIDEKNYLPMECKSIWKDRLILTESFSNTFIPQNNKTNLRTDIKGIHSSFSSLRATIVISKIGKEPSPFSFKVNRKFRNIATLTWWKCWILMIFWTVIFLVWLLKHGYLFRRSCSHFGSIQFCLF